MATSVLYIGAFGDATPLRIFTGVSRFVFVDQMPKDEMNHFSEDKGPKMCGWLRRSLRTCGRIVKTKLEQNCWEFVVENKSTKVVQHLTYHVNTHFPDDVTDEMTKGCDVLYERGVVLDWDCIASRLPQIRLIVTGDTCFHYNLFAFWRDDGVAVTRERRKRVLEYVTARVYFIYQKANGVVWPTKRDVETIKLLLS